MIKLAIAQMKIAGGEKERNLREAYGYIARAAESGANVVLLPETMDCGWTDPSGPALADIIPDGDVCSMLREAAQKHCIYVCSGLVEREGDKTYNAAVLFDAEGSILLKHRKINELDIGWPFYANGDRLGVVDTPFGRIGLMICADACARGHMVSRTLGLMGAQIILSPSAWAVVPGYDPQQTPYGKLWRDAYMPPAKEFGMWIAGCSGVGTIHSGPWTGHRQIGCSMVVDWNGLEVLQGPFGEEALLFVDIELSVPIRRHISPWAPLEAPKAG